MKHFWIGALFGAAILFLGLQAYQSWMINPQTNPLTVTETAIDTVTVHDTVWVSIPKKVYVESAPAIILPDTPDEVWLDTLISASEREIRIDTRISLGFNLRERLFHDVALDYPLIEYPCDTVYLTKTVRVPYMTPTKSQNRIGSYLTAGAIGFCIGATTYFLIDAQRQ